MVLTFEKSGEPNYARDALASGALVSSDFFQLVLSNSDNSGTIAS